MHGIEQFNPTVVEVAVASYSVSPPQPATHDGRRAWCEKVTDHFRTVSDNVELTLTVTQATGAVLSVDLMDANGQSVSAYFCISKIAKLTEENVGADVNRGYAFRI